MKINTLALTAATAGIAMAQPHVHKHRHLHEQQKRSVTTQAAAGATAVAWILGSEVITQQEACEGLLDGKYDWAPGNEDDSICASITTTSAAPSSTSSPSTTTTSSSSTTTVWSSSSSSTTTTTAPATSTAATSSTFVSTSSEAAAAFYQGGSWSSASTAAASGQSSASASSSSSSWSSSSSGVEATFPDGTLSCDTFPSEYGAVALDYLNMGGWAGIQTGSLINELISDIVTGIAGDSCTEGSFCSYACPPGYQKSQWPSTQGNTGQSVGGLACSGGVLKLTNSDLSSSLCIPGKGGVQAVNKASGVVSICRTDYPGTESETIPVVLSSGSTEELANPDASTYYTWEGKATSAQYYLNPPGYGASEACVWGSSSQPLGNYAPINFGVGYKDGTTWLSIFQNSPTTTATYPGTVELTGDLSGSCKYSDGQYCSASGCNSNGCTVSILSGTASYVISD